MDDRTPVIVEATERALVDCGAKALPIELVALTKIGPPRHRNAPRRVAERIGRPQARALQADQVGHATQAMLCLLVAVLAADRLRAGDASAAGGR